MPSGGIVVVVVVVVGVFLLFGAEGSCTTTNQCCPCTCCNEAYGSAGCVAFVTQTYCAPASSSCSAICSSHIGGDGHGYQAINCSQCVSPLGYTEDEGKATSETKELDEREKSEIIDIKMEGLGKEEATVTADIPPAINVPHHKDGTGCVNNYCCICTCCSESYGGRCVSGAEQPFNVCVTGEASNVCWGACESMIGGGNLQCTPPIVLPQPQPSCGYC